MKKKRWLCKLLKYNTGHSPGQAEGLAGCGHSKIARVRVLSWPLPVLTGLYFWRVTEVRSPSHGSVTQNSAVIGQAKNRFLRVG